MIRRRDGTILSNDEARFDFSEQDAREADFRGVYIFGGDFSDSDLRASDFSGAHLDGTNFYRANCSACDFTGAVLSGVFLDRVNLDYATFVDAQLVADSIGGACTLLATDLRFTDLANVVLTVANMTRLPCFLMGLILWLKAWFA